MINIIAKKKITCEKRNMEHKNLNFFINNSMNRLQRIKSGGRLFPVLESQTNENKEPLSIINQYLRTEGEALSLVSKKYKHNLQNKNEQPAKFLELLPNSFNVQDYFGTTKFNPKMEMAKETNLRDFFITKYNQVSKYLEEEKLENFFRNFYSQNDQSSLDKMSKDASKLISPKAGINVCFTKTINLKIPIFQHLEQVEKEIQLKVEEEFRREKEKAENEKKKIDLVQLANDKVSALAELQKKAELVSQYHNPKMKSKIAKLYIDDQENEILKEDKLRQLERKAQTGFKKIRHETTKEILKSVLDEGRLDFLKANRPRMSPSKSIQKNIAETILTKRENMVKFSQPFIIPNSISARTLEIFAKNKIIRNTEGNEQRSPLEGKEERMKNNWGKISEVDLRRSQEFKRNLKQ